jgi:hypothetical protein
MLVSLTAGPLMNCRSVAQRKCHIFCLQRLGIGIGIFREARRLRLGDASAQRAPATGVALRVNIQSNIP